MEPGACSTCVDTVNCLPCAVTLFRRLVGWLESDGVRFNQRKLHLALANQTSIPSGGLGRQVLGVTVARAVSLFGFPILSFALEIRILRGLPTVMFQAVTLHELGHVWLQSNGIQDLPPWAAEGFAQLLAWRFASRFTSGVGQAVARSIEGEPDPIYGDGFRRVRRLAERVGFHDFLRELRRCRRLPSTAESTSGALVMARR